MTDEQSQQHVDERLFFKFAQAVLSLVESRAKTEGIQRLTTSRSQFTEEGLATVVEERPAYWLLFRDLIENIASLPEAEEFARFALAKGVIRTPKLSDASGQPILAPTFEQVRPFIVHQLTTPVQDTLERTGSFQISDDRLLATYRTCRAAWIASTLTWLVVIPLINFDS